MFHIGVKQNVCPSHQGPFHGKEGPVKNMLKIGRGVKISHIHL